MSVSRVPARKPDISLFEEALPGSLFERLVRGVRSIGDEELRKPYSKTFWLPIGATPSNVAEEAVIELSGLIGPPPQCIGMEWWLGRLGYGKQLRFHFDRDMTLSKKTGQCVTPVFGSVFYLNNFNSSPTVIDDRIPGSDGKPQASTNPTLRKSVEPIANRYAVFRGDLYHGVVPNPESVKRANDNKTENDLPEARLTLLVNYCDRRPLPPSCDDYDGSVYGCLQKGNVYFSNKGKKRKGRRKGQA